jgi:hypothetical protein
MRKIWVVLLLAPLLLVSTVAASPLYSPESLARYFRLDWQVVPGPSGPTLEGYVYNQTDLMAVRMQLSIEELDAPATWSARAARGPGKCGSRSFFARASERELPGRCPLFHWLDKNVGN